MATQIDDEEVDIEEEVTPPPGPAKSKFPCRYCGVGHANALTRFHHEKNAHPEQVDASAADREEKARQKELAKMTGGISPDTLTELSKAFVEALDAAAPDMTPARRRQCIRAYDVNYPQSARDLENFLGDWSFSPPQIRIMVSSLFPARNRDSSEQGWGNGHGMVYAMDPSTGRQMPIIVLGQQGGGAAAPGPMFIQAPAAESPKETLTRQDVAAEIERVLERHTAKQVAAQPEQSAVRMRRHQEPLIGPDGLMVLDGNNNVAMRWVEEPVSNTDTLEKTLETLGRFGVIGNQAQVVDASAIAAEVKSQLPLQAAVPSLEVAELKRGNDELKEKMTNLAHQMEMKEEVAKAAENASSMVIGAMQPQLDELRNLRNREGMTDHQADLYHEEKLTSSLVSAFGQHLGSIRSDLRPLVISQAAAALKQQGLGPQAIVDMLQPQEGASSPAAPADRVSAAMDKWMT